MKKFLFILAGYFFFLSAHAAGKTFVFPLSQFQVNSNDTIPINIEKEDELIEEVVRTRTIPKKDEVTYFSQSTKYGFKNLFTNYSYNTSVPYTSQINPSAEIFVQDYIKTHGNYLQKMRGWGQPYFNLIENILNQYGLPKELKYIAVIESNLSIAATSSVGAGGPWQFMPYTARDFGLVVNSNLDERRDYYKSTHAAARYLLSLYRQMHDWLLVMAAYNGGPARVYSAIKKSGSNDFWRLQYYLPEESRTYVKRFIATHYIMEGKGTVAAFTKDVLPAANDVINRTTYSSKNAGLNPYSKQPILTVLTKDELVGIETLPVSGKYNAFVIAKNIEMDIVKFNHFNPSFDAVLASKGNIDLKLPADKMQLFVANKFKILNESVQVLLGGATVPDFKTVYLKVKKKK